MSSTNNVPCRQQGYQCGGCSKRNQGGIPGNCFSI